MLKKPFKILGRELTLTSSIAVIVFLILTGVFNSLGADLYNYIKDLNPSKVNNVIIKLSSILFYSIRINILTIFLFIIFLVPLIRYLDRKIFSKLITENIFLEDFKNNIHTWGLNYWGSTNPKKTNRIENGMMIFEASSNEWRQNLEGGACYDLHNNIINGRSYEISCKVKASSDCTMGFKLWVHDVVGEKSLNIPNDFEVPPSNSFKEYKLSFTATNSNAIRIHLHCKAGKGRIMINEVKVIRKKFF